MTGSAPPPEGEQGEEEKMEVAEEDEEEEDGKLGGAEAAQPMDVEDEANEVRRGRESLPDPGR
jgi:hypothetical protein